MQSAPCIFLVTYPGESDLTADDQLLLQAIEDQGGRAIPVCWSDPAIDWSEADVAVLRSTWDYIFHIEMFKDWIERVSSQTLLVNQPQLLLWNLDKRYLLDLQTKGVQVVPTLLVQGTCDDPADDLRSALAEFDRSIVIKPTVACGSHLARRFTVVSALSYSDALAHLTRILRHSAALIQPLIEEVFSHGERSLVFINGAYSHTAPKEPFREGLTPTYPNRTLISETGEVQFCEEVLSKLPVLPLYARLDIFVSKDQILLNELELIEPELHFHLRAGSASLLSSTLINYTKTSRAQRANLGAQTLSRE